MITWQQQLDEELYRHRRLPVVDNSDGPSTRWANALLAESTADIVDFPQPVEQHDRGETRTSIITGTVAS